MGAYFPQMPGTGDLKRLENMLSRPVDIVHLFQAWGNAENGFPAMEANEVASFGKKLVLTWEPWVLPENLSDPLRFTEQPEYALKEIINGRHDRYISSWAKAARESGVNIMLRPMHEMNGDWYPWCGTVNGNRPGDYVMAWRHIRGIFEEERVSNVEWVWCPYTLSVPDMPDNALETYFPGDESVDWLALDGYNWGNSRQWSRWQGFQELFAGSFKRLMEMSRRPLMIAETASAEEGGDKAAWINESAAVLEGELSMVKAVIWFNVNKECDWRIDSSEGALEQFRRNFGGLKNE